MNIFDVLNRGNSRLGEVSFTAWISYLLNPQLPHGLGDSFLDEFLSSLLPVTNQNMRIKELLEPGIQRAVICIPELELKDSEDNRQFADIVLKVGIVDDNSSKEADLKIKSDSLVNIIIEIKTNKGSVKKGQLNGYRKLLESEGAEDEYNLICFLTPDEKENGPLTEEFESLTSTVNIEKAWIKWKECFSSEDQNSETKDVMTMIRNILSNELLGKIQPINTYSLHTLKALANHIESAFEVSRKPKARQLPADHELLLQALKIPEKLDNLKNKLKLFLHNHYDSNQTEVFVSEDYNDKRFCRLCIRASQTKELIQIDCTISVRERPSVGLGISCVPTIKSLEDQKRILSKIEDQHPKLKYKSSGRDYLRIEEHGNATSIDNLDEITQRIADYMMVLSDEAL